MNDEQLTRIETLLIEIITMLKPQAQAAEIDNAPLDNKIEMVTRSVTKNSSSPMWRCTLQSGHTVNVFMHRDPDKNNFNLIEDAGYGAFFMELSDGDIQSWFTHPIGVKLIKDGKWWKLLHVDPIQDGDKPDLNSLDDIKQKFDDLGF